MVALVNDSSDAVYTGANRGVRLTTDEKDKLDELSKLYGECGSEVLRIALRHLWDRWTEPTDAPIPEPRV